MATVIPIISHSGYGGLPAGQNLFIDICGIVIITLVCIILPIYLIEDCDIESKKIFIIFMIILFLCWLMITISVIKLWI